MMSNPAMTSFFSVTAPTAANDSAVLVQASEVRIRARPGSASSRSGGLVVTAAAYRSAEPSTTTAAMTAITVTTAASSCGMTDRGSGWPCRSARWLLTHSLYAATATTAPNTISGTPSTCRPHGTPGKGGSSWTTPRPATTSASAVRLQARNVRSLAKVNLGSGSVPSSAGTCGCSLVTRHLQKSPRKSCQKPLAIAGCRTLTHGSQLGGVSKGSAGYQSPGIRIRRSRLAPTGAPSARPPHGRADGSHLIYLAGGLGNTAARGSAAWSAAPAACTLTPAWRALERTIR